jgi:hypothetical protein
MKLISTHNAPQFVCVTRPDGVIEQRDCTVRAFASATGQAYEIVHSAFSKAGRKSGKGCYLQRIAQDVAKMLGVTAQLVRRSGTVAKFLRDFPQGNYVIRVSGHAFAVINGVIHDNAPQSHARLVKSAWKIN